MLSMAHKVMGVRYISNEFGNIGGSMQYWFGVLVLPVVHTLVMLLQITCTGVI